MRKNRLIFPVICLIVFMLINCDKDNSTENDETITVTDIDGILIRP